MGFIHAPTVEIGLVQWGHARMKLITMVVLPMAGELHLWLSATHLPGYTRRMYGGHQSVPTSPPKVGYHGPEGYRRNTPDLRKQRSVFDYEGKPLHHSTMSNCSEL